MAPDKHDALSKLENILAGISGTVDAMDRRVNEISERVEELQKCAETIYDLVCTEQDVPVFDPDGSAVGGGATTNTSIPGTNYVAGGTNTVVVAEPLPEDLPVRPGGSIIHVNCRTGNDSLSGFSKTVIEDDGPKRTIRAARRIARSGDTIVIHAGTYHESLNITGSSVKVIIQKRL